MRIPLVFSLLLFSSVAVGSPCEEVDRALSETQQHKWTPVIEKQLKVNSVEILQLYRYQEWHILYVDTHGSDEAFIFFNGKPENSHYVAIWSGGAQKDEFTNIKKWTIENAKGIPEPLANCFAWHVTNNRDM